MKERADLHFTYTGVEMGIISRIPDVIYSRRRGQELPMTVYMHQRWSCDREHTERLPVIVFFDGSGYLHPTYDHCVGRLTKMAAAGFVVATVECGSFLDGWSFADISRNYKTAIRYLRANADKYGIDPARVISWGTSSGATSAAFAALSGDRPEYRTEEWPEVSDAVQCAVDMAGPQELRTLLMGTEVGKLFRDAWLSHADEADWERIVEEGSTLRLVEGNEKRCPFFLAHSVDDEVVPFSQTQKFHDALKAAGYDVQLAVVKGAAHTQSLTTELLDATLDFVKEVCGA